MSQPDLRQELLVAAAIADRKETDRLEPRHWAGPPGDPRDHQPLLSGAFLVPEGASPQTVLLLLPDFLEQFGKSGARTRTGFLFGWRYCLLVEDHFITEVL
jgi:hypothetical protein